MIVRLLTCAAMAAGRLAELTYSRRNLATAEAPAEDAANRAVYPLIVAVHATAILGTLFFGGRVRPAWLMVLVAVQPVRLWMLASLDRRWNARGAVAADMEVETGGPYRFVRHPNYVVIVVELLALPLAFGLRALAAVVSIANAGVLAVRIRSEEAALMELPGYPAYARKTKRFIPGLF